MYTFHIEVEGLQNYKLVRETHFQQIPTLCMDIISNIHVPNNNVSYLTCFQNVHVPTIQYLCNDLMFNLGK